MDVVVVGAGGHGMVVCDVLQKSGARVTGFVDRDAAKHGTRVLDVPVFATLEEAFGSARPAVAMGIGDNAARRGEMIRLRSAGFQILRVIHPSAMVSRHARIADGAVVMAGVVVNVGADIGENAILNTACSVDHHCVVGAHAHIAPGATLAGAVRVGEGTLVGAGAVIIPNVTVGAGCLVGAGAVVVDDVPDGITVVGTPARPVSRDTAHARSADDPSNAAVSR